MTMETEITHGSAADPLAGYLGAKGGSGVAARIISEMPPHYAYLELFAGSAKVARLKRPAKINYLVDKDPDVIGKLKALTDDNLTFFDIKEGSSFDFLENPDGLCSYASTLVYLDPPYPASVRGRARYKHDMRDDDWHRSMLLPLTHLGCMIIISSYPNDMYDGILAGWRTVDIPTVTRGGKRIERLWCNFPAPTYLHDPRFAGKDARARWRLSKRVARWKAKYLGMGEAERQMVMEELASADPKVMRLRRGR